MKYRCDKAFDCKDQSDEEDCDYFIVDSKTYNKKHPSISKEQKMEIKVHMVIKKLQNIRELDMSFDAKFTITMEWFDSRLTYKNIFDNYLTNLVKEENKAQIWLLELVFNNTNKDVMTTNGPNSALFINKQGNPTNAPITNINEDFYYKGSENKLVLTIGHDLTFQCDFQLKHYPFDTQRCLIEINNI